MNRAEHTQKMREKWGLLIGPKSNQFDQNKALETIIRETLAWAEEQIEEAMSENGNNMLVAKRRIITRFKEIQGL